MGRYLECSLSDVPQVYTPNLWSYLRLFSIFVFLDERKQESYELGILDKASTVYESLSILKQLQIQTTSIFEQKIADQKG